MRTERRLPKMHLKAGIRWIALELGCILLAVFFGTVHELHWLFGILAAFFAFGAILLPFALLILWHKKRCPECSTPLVFRRDAIPGSFRYRCLYDCPQCEITWDTGLVGDSRYDS